MRPGLLLLPLAIALAACGGGSAGDAGSAPADAATSAAATPAADATTASAPSGSPTSPAKQGAPAAAGTPTTAAAQPAPQASPTRVAVAAPDGAVPMPGQQELPPEEKLATLPTPSPGGGVTAVADGCSLVPANALSVLAPGLAGSPASVGSEAFSMSGCVWGSLGDNRMLVLYVLTPGQLADPGALFVPSTAAAPAPTPPGGNVWGTVQVGGTSAAGLTYGWTVKGKQVVLITIGPVDDAVRASTLEAARAVTTALGG